MLWRSICRLGRERWRRTSTPEIFGEILTVLVVRRGPVAAKHEPADPGPHTQEALRKFLAACPLIRTVELRSDSSNVDFYRNYVFKALRGAGRRVALAPAGTLTGPAFLKGAAEAGDAAPSTEAR